MLKTVIYIFSIRKIILFLSIFYLILPNICYSNSKFNQSDVNTIESIIEQWLIKNPEKLRTILTNLEKKEKDSFFKETMLLLSESSDNPIIGNPNADVTIYEFFDYNCGYCKSVFDTLMSVVLEDGNIKVVLIEFPILSKTSELAARLALASKKQNSYSEFHTELMRYRGRIVEDSLLKIAKKIDLNIEQLKKDAFSSKIEGILAKNRLIAQRLELSGTPAFIIGKTVVPGAMDRSQIIKLVSLTREEKS
jgi:hypothetical protein